MRLLLDVLRTAGFLAGGSPEAVTEFAALGRVKTFARNHVVWRAGQGPESVVIPVTGEAAALGRDAAGRGICYAFFGTGECVGLPAAIDGLPQPRELRVIRGGDFFLVDRVSFLRFLDAHPSARAWVVASIGALFRASLDERDREVFQPVHARVARFLLEHACVRRADGARILMRETQPEIAIRLGSVREVVAREMSAFREQGLIRRTPHAIFVLDWDALCAKAGDDGRESERRAAGDPSTAAVRTERFFLPVLDGGAHRLDEERRICGEHLAGFRGCAARGCPLALGAGDPHEAPGRDAHAHGGSEGHDAPRAHGPQAHAPRSKPADAAHPHRTHGAHPPTRHAAPIFIVRAKEDSVVRSPSESEEIRRRIELYRRRAAGIESKFGGEEHVPSCASVFEVPPGA